MLLNAENIDAGYGEVQILWNVSLKVDEGEIAALLGSNGAGKTTTLKVLSGLIPPFKGRIYLRDKDISHLKPYERVELGLSLVPEGRQLFPRLSVYKNLKAAAYTKKAREKFQDTLEVIYNIFPILKERRDQPAGTLSGGEQQMLAIARSLVTRPILLMMDEPSLGLAPKLVLEIIDLVSRLREEGGYTILLVEQNVHHALKIADRAYIMETGRIVKEGSGKDLLNDPDVKKAYLGL